MTRTQKIILGIASLGIVWTLLQVYVIQPGSTLSIINFRSEWSYLQMALVLLIGILSGLTIAITLLLTIPRRKTNQ